MLWKIAWRNLWRHRGRTLIMTSAVALAYGLMLLGMGINDDGHARMLEEAARAAGGDVLVHGEGYWETRGGDMVVPEADAVADAGGVFIVSPDANPAVIERSRARGMGSYPGVFSRIARRTSSTEPKMCRSRANCMLSMSRS